MGLGAWRFLLFFGVRWGSSEYWFGWDYFDAFWCGLATLFGVLQILAFCFAD